MSRRPRAEQQFGSDSFLDIVCNVVGILIILMVVTGLRASRAPVLLPTMTVPTVPVAGPAAEPDSLPILPVFGDEPEPEPVVVAAPPPEPEPEPEPIVPPPELIAEARRLRQQMLELEQSTEAAGRRSAEMERRLSELQAKLDALSKQQTAQQELLLSAKQRRAASDQELAQLRQVLARLTSSVETEQAKAPPSKQLEHRITPIGRTVQGQEYHFRLLENRVAVVPLQRLIDRLQAQVERHKDWIAKSRQQLGQVGPVDGFTLHYAVERETASLADELRMGPGVFRISVTEWRLEADRQLETEAVTEALEPGSRFLSALSSAEDGAAMTFWVYPDSFAAYGELKAYCQRQNFLTAGRPLPKGIPIAGSPTGSKSSGQ